MRLSEREQQAIREIVRREDPSAEIYLFGSRLNDDRKGGDIDLYLEIGVDQELLGLKTRILSSLWERLGPQKIDLLIHRRQTPHTAFETEIQRSGRLL
ncbi:MAG: nucleotidyltransferase domain-containing protein [Acidihalobacter sp.]|jgi:predicted nucleotidyltransferase|uniref:nucleotidyltransferase domain-containing protein n=1 Tax=Acidihalobacter sp. TaxID=1872108 RepID=UPI00307DD26D